MFYAKFNTRRDTVRTHRCPVGLVNRPLGRSPRSFARTAHLLRSALLHYDRSARLLCSWPRSLTLLTPSRDSEIHEYVFTLLTNSMGRNASLETRPYTYKPNQIGQRLQLHLQLQLRVKMVRTPLTLTRTGASLSSLAGGCVHVPISLIRFLCFIVACTRPCSRLFNPLC